MKDLDTVCFLDRRPQKECRVTFDIGLSYSFLCSHIVTHTLSFAFRGSFNNHLFLWLLTVDTLHGYM